VNFTPCRKDVTCILSVAAFILIAAAFAGISALLFTAAIHDTNPASKALDALVAVLTLVAALLAVAGAKEVLET